MQTVRKHKSDRRVARTRHALTLALIDLVSRKRYGSITIQDLLERADVGRSTFYSHYKGKDDLLLTSWGDMLDMLDDSLLRGDGRIAPVRELFDHVGGMRGFHEALARARILDRVYEAGTRRLSRSIARRLEPGPVLEVRARACAGALFALLRWWVDNGAPHSPAAMDAMYHDVMVGS